MVDPRSYPQRQQNNVPWEDGQLSHICRTRSSVDVGPSASDLYPGITVTSAADSMGMTRSAQGRRPVFDLHPHHLHVNNLNCFGKIVPVAQWDTSYGNLKSNIKSRIFVLLWQNRIKTYFFLLKILEVKE